MRYPANVIHWLRFIPTTAAVAAAAALLLMLCTSVAIAADDAAPTPDAAAQKLPGAGAETKDEADTHASSPHATSEKLPGVPGAGAGDRDTLWVVTQGGGSFRLLYRSTDMPAGVLYVALESKGSVLRLAASQSHAYLLFDNGILQSVQFVDDPQTGLPDYPVRQLPPLPDGAKPADISAGPLGLLILAHIANTPAKPDATSNSVGPDDLFNRPDDQRWWFQSAPSPAPSPSSAAPTASPPLSGQAIYRLSNGQWQRLPAPADMDWSASPHVAALHDRPVVATYTGGELTLHQFNGSQWSADRTKMQLANDWRLLNIGEHLVLIDRQANASTSGTQLAAKLFFDGRWLDAGVMELPMGRRLNWSPTGYDDQLTVLLSAADDPGDLSYLQRDLQSPPDSPPGSVTLKITQRPTPPINRDLLMFGLFAVAMLIMMSVWRRDPKANAVQLPPTMVPAELTRRVIALMIDMLPAWVVLYYLAGSSGTDAFVQRWPDHTDWAQLYISLLVIGLTTVHVTLSELFTGRSLGKWITGCRVVSRNGKPPNLWQVLTRNAIRIIELMALPLLFLAVLNVSHQRLGDLAARTVVVRRAKPGETTGSKSPDSDE